MKKLLILLIVFGFGLAKAQQNLPVLGEGYQDTPLIPGTQWHVHDNRRPYPPVVKPGAFVSVPAPADAVVLFDGTNMDKWCKSDGSPSGWRIVDGYMEAVPKQGSLRTKDSFGSCQLHVEWASPVGVTSKGQSRGNSGVIIQGMYEIQVLDNYGNTTYADGQAASIYGQYPPLVNVCRPQGEWQSYDIIFNAPKFAEDGKLLSPAYITVFHNGVLVQNHREVFGPTGHKTIGKYSKHGKRPLSLQDHGNPTRYKYIWIRELED